MVNEIIIYKYRYLRVTHIEVERILISFVCFAFEGTFYFLVNFYSQAKRRALYFCLSFIQYLFIFVSVAKVFLSARLNTNQDTGRMRAQMSTYSRLQNVNQPTNQLTSQVTSYFSFVQINFSIIINEHLVRGSSFIHLLIYLFLVTEILHVCMC